MPDVYFLKGVYLEDYFAKYGFDDGSEEWIGWEYREQMLEILNKHLNKLNITAIELDVGSSHNNCQIGLQYNGVDVEEKPYYLDLEDNLRDWKKWKKVVKDKETAKAIVDAISEAEKEFEEEALDDLSRVLNTPDEDLPLLVGKLKNEKAKKLYERLMKGATHESNE